MPERFACVVLAAGEGRRFGGVKQLARIGESTVLETVLDNVRAVPLLAPVVCVLGAHAEAIQARIDFGDVDVVVADDWADGQAASLKAGVRAVSGADAVLVVLGDQPGVTPQVIAGVVDRYDPARFDAVRPTYGGVPGNPVLLGPRLLADVPRLAGDHGARELLQIARVRRWEAGHLCDPTDIDTPEALEVFSP
jgi:molybdenum cofactor cytidylyltransferase